MKKIDVGQAITILANFGVIAGIVFLGIELRQNNEQTQLQTRTTMYQIREQNRTAYVQNVGGIAELETKWMQGEPLTSTERARLNAYRAQAFDTFEFMYRTDYEEALASAGWMGFIFRNGPDSREYWDDIKGRRDPEFVEFIEEHVLPRAFVPRR